MKTYHHLLLWFFLLGGLVACQESRLSATEVAPSPTSDLIEVASDNGYWPTESWRTSTPEAQGMDSEQLVAMMEFIQAESLDLHGLLIARNGTIVAEAAFYPYELDMPHVAYSMSKSVTSTLVGIALAEGLIENVDQTMCSFFSDRQIALLDERKER